jgi:hypothetical protein
MAVMMPRPFPVTYEIARPERYNRLTVAFRLILVIPQALLVGGGGYYFGVFQSFDRNSGHQGIFGLFNGGVLNAVLSLLVFFAWIAILFTGRFPNSFRDFCHMIFRWSQNVHAYVLLLSDPYPPFGDSPYPLRIGIVPAAQYNRWAVFFRLILVIPHAIVLAFLGIAQFVVTIIAWFAILFTGQYPEGLYEFSVGVSRWGARVSAYFLLFVDEYPPFTLASEPGGEPAFFEPA